MRIFDFFFTHISWLLSIVTSPCFPGTTTMGQRSFFSRPLRIPRYTRLMTLNGQTLNRKTTTPENYVCMYIYVHMYMRASITRRSRWLTCGTQKWNFSRERERERKKNRWPPRSFGKASTSSRYRRTSVFRNSSVIDCSLLSTPAFT